MFYIWRPTTTTIAELITASSHNMDPINAEIIRQVVNTLSEGRAVPHERCAVVESRPRIIVEITRSTAAHVKALVEGIRKEIDQQ